MRQFIRQVFEKDGYLEIGVRLATLLGIGFGVFAYYHTVHPVFTKEHELLEAKGEAESLRNEGVRLQSDIEETARRLEALTQEVKAKEEQIASLQSYASQKASEAVALAKHSDALEVTLGQRQVELVKQTTMRHMDRLANEAINAEVSRMYRTESQPFDLQKRALQLVQEGMKASPTGAEHAALRVLELFATKKLEPGISDFKPIFELMMFVEFDEEALAIIRSTP